MAPNDQPEATLPACFGLGVTRHGPEVPKFVFMAVGFETYGHASRMAQLITFSVESPPTYILLNLKNSISVHLNKTPTVPDI